MIVPFRQPVGAAREDWEALAAWVLESDKIVIQPCANGVTMVIDDEERLVPSGLEHSFMLALDLGWGCA